MDYWRATSGESRRYPAFTRPGKAQNEENDGTCDVEQARRNYAQVNSDSGPVNGGEKTIVEEEQSKLSEKHSERIDKDTSENGHLCHSTWWSEATLPIIGSSLPLFHCSLSRQLARPIHGALSLLYLPAR